MDEYSYPFNCLKDQHVLHWPSHYHGWRQALSGPLLWPLVDHYPFAWFLSAFGFAHRTVLSSTMALLDVRYLVHHMSDYLMAEVASRW